MFFSKNNHLAKTKSTMQSAKFRAIPRLCLFYLVMPKSIHEICKTNSDYFGPMQVNQVCYVIIVGGKPMRMLNYVRSYDRVFMKKKSFFLNEIVQSTSGLCRSELLQIRSRLQYFIPSPYLSNNRRVIASSFSYTKVYNHCFNLGWVKNVREKFVREN